MYPFFLCLSLLSPGQPSADELAVEAEKSFAEGLADRQRDQRGTHAFRRSAELLEAMIQNGSHNALLYRNLGNAYLLAGDRPRAVLAYRRGLRYEPGNAPLMETLQFLRTEIAQHDPGLVPVQREWPWVGVRPIFWGSTCAYLTACLLFTRWRMTRQSPWILCSVLALVVALLGAGLFWSITREPPGESAVISRSALLRKGNGEGFTPWSESPLPEGTEVRLLHQLEGWGQIELADGRAGWVPIRDLLLESAMHP